ncbi:uncharacterized protein LOC129911016 [Episyrphus balteatus]|uniref:uncharacterized protein LOC129911016 n=1 Tax=Episyrphus balteatus TaxID=286459 RepID=UPI00248689C5|nr:uncharacterized protein LOC129911016 [Episyrphus balteatus]
MGRQFEYNRFSNDEDIKQEVGGASDCKQKEFMQKSQSPQTNKKSKTLKKYDTRICPPYSELYPENDNIPLKDETTTTKRTTTKSTRKSVEIAIKTYHQLSKFLIQSQNNEDIITSDTSTATTESSKTLEKDDCEMIALAASVPKKPKVYDCMRDFLRKKFFHHAVVSVSEEESSEEAVEYDDEVDYLTMMEDSYDIKDVDDDFVDDDDECLLVVTSNHQHQTRSKCIRLVEGGCWPKNEFYLEDGDDEVDSDVGIKDCCQLLGGSPKAEKNTKSPKRKLSELQSELRDVPWFQPNISGKAAAEKLSKEDPGAFIIRQSSSVKPGNYILSLRMETKVKKFIILGSPRCYKIKGAKKEFSSLKALVTHHSVMAEQLPVTLSLPRTTVDEKFSHRYIDDFDTFESLQILGILKFLQSKNLEFS